MIVWLEIFLFAVGLLGGVVLLVRWKSLAPWGSGRPLALVACTMAVLSAVASSFTMIAGLSVIECGGHFSIRAPDLNCRIPAIAWCVWMASLTIGGIATVAAVFAVMSHRKRGAPAVLGGGTE